jgi:hypothetical protein
MNFIHNDNIFLYFTKQTHYGIIIYSKTRGGEMKPFERQEELDALEKIIFPHRFGFPVVESPADLGPILTMLHIRPWEKVRLGLTLVEYTSLALKPDQIEELRYAPTPWVTVFHHPNGSIFTGFSSQGRSWSTVVVPLEDKDYGTLIPMTVEFKHGREQVMLVPFSGVPNAQERQQANGYELCGVREVLEESGIKLKEIHRLTGSDLPISGRQTNQGAHLFLGIADDPSTWTAPKFDRHELLRVVLMTPDTLMEMVAKGTEPHIGIEMCGALAVALAIPRYKSL